MKNKNLMRLSRFGLVMLWFFLPCRASSQLVPSNDNTTVVAFSRHTFRGISKNVGPQKIDLSQYGIGTEKDKLPIPTLSYGEDATPRGLIIAARFAAPGLQEAAALAVEAIAENKVFDGHWDEVRAELASQRTFWTGLYLIKGIKEQDAEHNRAIKFTGCPTVAGAAVDAVSSDHPIRECVSTDKDSKAVFLQLLKASPDLPKLKNTFQDFLNTVRAYLGEDDKVLIPDARYSEDKKGNPVLPKVYDEIAALASIIEMIAELGPPLEQIFHRSVPELGKIALQQGVDGLGIRFFTSEPSPLSDAVSVFPVNYMMSRPQGSHTIVVSHDNMMSALMSSLGIISSNGAPDTWAIFPIETYVFAFGSSNVSIVRMRVEISGPDGAIPGNYGSKVVWKGSVQQWNEKVMALNERAKTLNLGPGGNACVNAVKECEAEAIDVVVHDRSPATLLPPPGGVPQGGVFNDPRNLINTRDPNGDFEDP